MAFLAHAFNSDRPIRLADWPQPRHRMFQRVRKHRNSNSQPEWKPSLR